MDGTRPARVFWRITLPLLMPNLLVVIVLALIRAVQIFDEVYVLTGGGPGTSTMFLTQYIYETGFASLLRNPGLAAAASILMGAGPGRAHPRPARPRPPQRAREARDERALGFLTRRRGGRGWHWTDSSPAPGWPAGCPDVRPGALARRLLVQDARSSSPSSRRRSCPTSPQSRGRGNDEPQPLYRVTCADGTRARAGRAAPHRHRRPDGRPATPRTRCEGHRSPTARRCAVRRFAVRTTPSPSCTSTSCAYLRNSVFVTVDGDADHAAHQLDGRLRAVASTSSAAASAVMLLIVATLMVPLSVILVPLYSVDLARSACSTALGRDPAHGRHARPASSCCASTC